MADDDAKDTETSRSIPCTADGIKITIGNNKAAIAGALHEISRWSTRTGMHVDLIQNRAVPLSNGRLAVESPLSIPFIQESLVDQTRYYLSADKTTICPTVADRASAHKTKTGKEVEKPDKVDPAFLVAPHAVATPHTVFTSTPRV